MKPVVVALAAALLLAGGAGGVAPPAVDQALVDGALRNSGGSTDPVDVPRAIAGLIAMAPGKRPLRLPVHPGAKPQLAINKVSAETQVAMLGNSPFGPWVKDVNGRT